MTYNKTVLNSNIDKKKAEQFGIRLRKTNYRFLYMSTLGPLSPVNNWIDEQWGVELISKLPRHEAAFIKFMMYGYNCKIEDIDLEIGVEGVSFLKEIQFAKEINGELVPNGYSIIPVGALYLIVSIPIGYENAQSKFSDIYIGQDSLRLMQMTNNISFKNTLDLCAGSGIQGLNLLMNGRSEHVDAVEINECAWNAAIINALINGIEKYNIFEGNLYQAKGIKGRYDCIISNPPYVPTPNGISMPICGDGGEDGLTIAKKIIDGYSSFLEEDGRAYMILECPGNESNPFILDYFVDVVKTGTINVGLYSVQAIEFQAAASAEMVCAFEDKQDDYDRYYDSWMDMFRRIGAKYMYPVVIEYINDRRSLKINVVRNYKVWGAAPNFVIGDNVEWRKEERLFYTALQDGKRKLSISEQMYRKLITGDQEVLDDRRKKIQDVRDYLETLSILEQQGIVLRKD